MIAKEEFTIVSIKYINFADTFSSNLAFKLAKYTEINNYAIELVDGQQSLYKPIYSLKLVELGILKDYIKIDLANNFIQPSKLLVSFSIFCDQKLDRFFWLFVNYSNFNNVTFKN